MNVLVLLLYTGAILLACVISSKFINKLGVPTLLIFLGLGMVCGSPYVLNIKFEDTMLARDICTIALSFIIFLGGFGVNLKVAKKVIKPAVVLASAGTVITAFVAGLFAVFALKLSLLEGLLLGAVVSSTDFASVFSILRTKNLSLKNSLDSLLEVESGSNDPYSYMFTIVILSLMSAGSEQTFFGVVLLLVEQVVLGVLGGIVFGLLARLLLSKMELEISGLYPILTLGLVLLCFSLTGIVNGNSFLALYIMGIVLGNYRFKQKRPMLHFLDGISWLMQIIIFFTLGLLVVPSELLPVFIPGLIIAVFLVLVARPIAVAAILLPFKFNIKEISLVSWVGLRGVASIVFATFAVAQNVEIASLLFNVVFMISIISVGLQGTLIPAVATKLELTEPDNSVFKTFNDYEHEVSVSLVEFELEESSNSSNKKVRDISLPPQARIIFVRRAGELHVPNGKTLLLPGDTLILAGKDIEKMDTAAL